MLVRGEIMKKIYIVIGIIFVLGLGISFAGYMQMNKKPAVDQGVVSPDVTDYKRCVAVGGKVNREVAPSSCTYRDKTFTDGNF